MDLQINFVYLKIHSQKIVDFFEKGCGESRKKKFTSLTCVCNEHGKPISIINNAAYTKTINETKIINTLPHDSQSILPSIKNINTKKQWGWRKLTSDDFSIKSIYLIDNFYQKIRYFLIKIKIIYLIICI